MWDKTTAEKLRAQLERLTEQLQTLWNAGNKKKWLELGIEFRRVEVALDRLQFGRVK
jgi:hypothetical protein